MKFRGLLLTTSLVIAPAAFADGDSSSDAAAGFVQSLSSNEGLMIAVPVNANDEELVAEAETRLVSSALTSTSDFATAFDSATAVNTDNVVSDFDVNADSSTSGWYHRGDSYRTHNYYRTSRTWCPTYYRSYTPSYYYHGHSYDYHRPIYRTYVGQRHHNRDHNYHGYRYYYYDRGWH